ncbi:GD18825 [Drosophila simulans]|uniref:GD18825 n=1 Tax=Drosophila simulans TaxID=7240 RepID=B4QSW3_DROSI|nr:GD18825 [Drosophila simulans]
MRWELFLNGHLLLAMVCLDSVDIFPYLREPVIENATLAADTFCQHSRERSATPIYSAGRLLGLRLRFQQPPTDLASWNLTLNASYRFLKRENFRTDGRLVPHSFCDFYFFASLSSEEGNVGQGYFHSPQFPAHYPAHIKCAYKFIGRPDTHVEILFEELQLPPVVSGGCQLDAITLFDAESAHMNSVIDVICSSRPTRRLVSTGPDLLLEFNASSNRTAKGFRGKYKFVSNELGVPKASVPPPAVWEAASVVAKQEKLQQEQAKENSLPSDVELSKPGRSFASVWFGPETDAANSQSWSQVIGHVNGCGLWAWLSLLPTVVTFKWRESQRSSYNLVCVVILFIN